MHIMRTVIAAVAFVVSGACAHAPASPAVPPPSPTMAAPTPAPPKPAALTEETLKKLSHDTIDAFDRGDVAALGAALSPAFVHFEGGDKPTTRDKELASMAKRKPGAPHIGSRTWDQEHVLVFPDHAVFIGLASEKMAGNDVHGGYLYKGWYTLSWRPEGDAWKLALWTWRRGGTAEERDMWNETFRNNVGFNKEPNRLLVETVKGKKPGAALDVAMGQGRNALYLASQGWKTTGVDFSDEGIRMARATAEEKKLKLDAINIDIDKFDFGTNKWDLVTLIYAGDDPKEVEKIKASLKRGGMFVCEFFHDDENKPDVHNGWKTGELRKLFENGYEILRDDVVEDVPDWARDRATLVRFVARKL
jgi:SAM-dependent methyltransferase